MLECRPWRGYLAAMRQLDVALLVPFQPRATSWVDPTVRGMFGAPKLAAIRGRDRLFEFLGFAPEYNPHAIPWQQRSLTAVALATSLERARLRWRVLDPGAVSLAEWRRRLELLRAESPRFIAISSTFVNDGFWLGSLCALVREILPDARVGVGGYFYATDAKQFLALDADILCVGEGEVRIVSITEAIRDGRALEGIPGLYLRDRQGKLRYTGNVEPLRLDELLPPDWSLSMRIEPSVDLEHESNAYSVETQRGCVFKCDFCTFRTLAAPVLGSVDRAVSVIQDAARGKGIVWVVDGTATYPRDRWRQILERLIELGGSRLPIHAYARVTDLDEEVCSLMERAGVRYVLIGQESGDQRVLNAIRKGTRVDQLRPAIAALGRHGIEPGLSFMYGFPGEDAESLATTRRLISTINEGAESRPIVQHVTVQPFAAQDFAGVQQHGPLKDIEHRYGWNKLEISPARAAEEAMLTYLELSQIPHAPITAFDGIVSARQLFAAKDTDGVVDLFRFSKAIDRGIGIFAEEELEGKRPDLQKLRRIRTEILERLHPDLQNQHVWKRVLARANHRATWQVMGEWVREPTSGVGPLTRFAIGWEIGRVTRRPEHVVESIQSGRYPAVGVIPPSADPEPRRAEADQLVRLGVATGKRRLARAG